MKLIANLYPAGLRKYPILASVILHLFQSKSANPDKILEQQFLNEKSFLIMQLPAILDT